jgi:uncharacterized protein YqiB (DUF1249 family)
MARIRYTLSTIPVVPPPSPLLLFIQQAQLALVTRSDQAERLKATEQPPAAAA